MCVVLWSLWAFGSAPRRLKAIVLFLRSLLLHNLVLNHGAVEVKQEETPIKKKEEETGAKHDDIRVFKSL